jgi:uncharacterized protein YdhG (YjbR/CyaY superfamily)
MPPFPSIDAYIQSTPPEVQPVLQAFRQAIQQAAPKAEESITYNMPTFTFFQSHDHRVHLAAWKKHIGFYGATSAALAAYKNELAAYVTPKGTLQFPLNQPLPLPLIRKLIKFLVKEAKDSQA